MKHMVIILLCMTFHVAGSIHTVNIQKALTALSHTPKEVLIFVNIDKRDFDHLYTQNFDETIKKARLLCHHRKKEGYQVLSSINRVMETIDPFYIAAHHICPHIIGLTRRSLRWAHLIRKSCQEQGISLPPSRFLYAVTKENPQHEDDYSFFECNGNILYIDQIDLAKALSCYIVNHPASVHSIIYADTSLESITSCLHTLQLLHPTIKTLGLHLQE